MYWIIEQGIGQENRPYIVYNFFQIITLINLKKAVYNPVLKTTKYPIQKEVVVRAYVAESPEDFLEYYYKEQRL